MNNEIKTSDSCDSENETKMQDTEEGIDKNDSYQVEDEINETEIERQTNDELEDRYERTKNIKAIDCILNEGKNEENDGLEIRCQGKVNINTKDIILSEEKNESRPMSSRGSTDYNKHVTYKEQVEVIESDSIHNNKHLRDQVDNIEPVGKLHDGGLALSDLNFKRRVTFSNEIIVIPYDETLVYNEDEETIEDCNVNESHLDQKPYGKLFGHSKDVDGLTVNYANTVSNRNIFKTVSFSNEVTVIHDGNIMLLPEASDSDESTPSYGGGRVDELLNKLKKVVRKLEDKTKHGANRDKKVLGDAEQGKTSQQIQVVKVDNGEKQVAFSDQIECIQIEDGFVEQREPNLRKVTFSKEIIVIAYPYKDDDIEYDESDETHAKHTTTLMDKELLDMTKYAETEQSTVDYAERVISNKNIFKTVSFSNEVTVIHDVNRVFRSDSNESVKQSFETKEMECEECDQ